jgi:hypothetical protein
LYLLSSSLAGLDGCNNNDDGAASLNGNGLWNMQKEKEWSGWDLNVSSPSIFTVILDRR